MSATSDNIQQHLFAALLCHKYPVKYYCLVADSSVTIPASSDHKLRYSNTSVPQWRTASYSERPCMPSVPHILIAEDHAAVRNLLTTIVARIYPNCTITTVVNGAEALTAFQAHGADLLITDYTMPIMTGLALISGAPRPAGDGADPGDVDEYSDFTSYVAGRRKSLSFQTICPA